MHLHRWAIAAVVVLTAAAVPACGNSGSDDSKGAGGLEKTGLKVGYLPIVDDAPLFIAQKKGYFKQEGLRVTPVALANGEASTTKLQAGAVDLAWASYPNFLPGVASGVLKLRIVADGYHTVPHLFPVLTLPKSPIKKPADLIGKKVAVNSAKGLSPMMLSAALKNTGVDPKGVKLVEFPFPLQPAALQNHSVDAICATEPFATQVKQKLGAVEVMDTGIGPSAHLPVAGWQTTERTAEKDPKTLAAFKRAMAKAQTDAQNRTNVEAVLPGYTKVSRSVASKITLGTFPTTTSRARLQRVPDLMLQVGQLKSHYDISKAMVSAGK